MADNPKKRKKESSNGAASIKKPRFPSKTRSVFATTATTSAYPNGELNVSRFLRAHENEIKSLENAIKAAKTGLSRRAFQDVPRELRRRTGSHNPQRVPKRLRNRAKREAHEDNTPLHKDKSGSGIGKHDKQKWLRKEGIDKAKKAKERRERRRAKAESKFTVTSDATTGDGEQATVPVALGKSPDIRIKKRKENKLAIHPTPPSRFRRRQVHKTWLPTHVWHSKRATMTAPKEPLWRFAIPLAPAVKSYRLTYRAASLRGAVAWDMSYMATISLEGPEASIVSLLKAVHFAEEDTQDPWAVVRKGKRWRAGTRTWEGWIYEREGDIPKKLAQVVVIWCVQPEVNVKKRKVLVRVHPCAFLQVWQELVRVSKMQKPAISVEDLRFEIGSIEIMGPGAAETLSSILSPNQGDLSSGIPSDLWSFLPAMTDSGMLPSGALLSCLISDPRLQDPPSTSSAPQDDEYYRRLTEHLATWPVDESLRPSEIFNRSARLAASRCLPSQKSINRRKSAAPPGQYPEARSTDPHIPMLTYVSQSSKTWTVLLPWKCVMPVWRCMMRYPVSTGGNPRFGGVEQRRQVDYERSIPSFPFDHPGTDAGWDWELQRRVFRQSDWTRRPRGKRIEWSKIDLGRGRIGECGAPWACEWERLISKDCEEQAPNKKLELRSAPARQLSTDIAIRLLEDQSTASPLSSLPQFFTVKITMVQRGVPTDCARIYKLPSKDSDLRQKWLSLMPDRQSAAPKRSSERLPSSSSKTINLSKHARSKALALSLLEPYEAKDGTIKAGDPNYPCVPDNTDLIGFVTTGNYNLAEGRPTAIANLVLQRVLSNAGLDSKLQKGVKGDERICIVREAGQSIGRLARWEVV